MNFNLKDTTLLSPALVACQAILTGEFIIIGSQFIRVFLGISFLFNRVVMIKFYGWEGYFVIQERFQKLQAEPGVERSLLNWCCLDKLENETYLLTDWSLSGRKSNYIWIVSSNYLEMKRSQCMLLQGGRRKWLVIIILSVQENCFTPLESLVKGGMKTKQRTSNPSLNV